jgi:multidrug efflux system membrane fusion protein
MIGAVVAPRTGSPGMVEARRAVWIATALVALALPACGKKDDPAAAAPPGGGGAPVTVAPAESKAVTETQEFPARLEAFEKVDVRSRVTGYIEAIHFQQGTEVRKGELLVTIDPRPNEAKVARAQADVAAIGARIELARIELARAEKLLASQATSQREYDEKAAQVKDLEATRHALQATLDAAKLDLSFTRIVAPIGGRVGKAEITAGNFVQTEGPESPLLTTIVSIHPVYVSFEIDERVFVKFGLRSRAGGRNGRLPVEVALMGESGFPRKALLDFVDNRVDPATGSVRMRATLDNRDGALTPGLYAHVRLSDPAGANAAVVVPERAIGTDQDRKFVYVVGEDRKAQYRPVKTGPVVDGNRVVFDGIKPGELVIVNGLLRVRPGQPVAAEREKPATAATGDKK